MTLKGWVLGKVNPTIKADAPRAGPRSGRLAPSLGSVGSERDPREPEIREPGLRDPRRGPDAHLGRYAPLVGAVREALESFVANELRLHLAIAERDRYLLTSIDVESNDSEEHEELLQRFLREFKPEQVKQYLARDVIGGLRNASAIDLTQFGGLNATREPEPDDEDDPYRELVAQLQSADETPVVRPYEVTIVGRWSEDGEVRARPRSATGARARVAPGPHTPLAGRPLALEVEDGNGARRIELDAMPAGRRYTIGKDGACDLVIDGVYASRRHCELWCEDGVWRVQDNGSTNGIRVEAQGAVRRAGGERGASAQPIEIGPGALLVLSAHGQGTPGEYPRVAALGSAGDVAVPGTLATPIAPARQVLAPYRIAARMISGPHETELAPTALPFAIGRSRNQRLVIDWAHADVSGRHLEVTALDDAGALVRVLGENGVRLGERTFDEGAEFHWPAGEELVLGRAERSAASCTLTLVRNP